MAQVVYNRAFANNCGIPVAGRLHAWGAGQHRPPASLGFQTYSSHVGTTWHSLQLQHRTKSQRAVSKIGPLLPVICRARGLPPS